jgi:hypothetical protein
VGVVAEPVGKFPGEGHSRPVDPCLGASKYVDLVVAEPNLKVFYRVVPVRVGVEALDIVVGQPEDAIWFRSARRIAVVLVVGEDSQSGVPGVVRLPCTRSRGSWRVIL